MYGSFYTNNIHFERALMNITKHALLIFLIPIIQPSFGLSLFLPDGSAQPALKNLLHAFSISVQTPAQVVKETQEKWLRTVNKERWEAEDPYAARKQELMPLFQQLGLVDEIKPIQREYDYVLVMG